MRFVIIGCGSMGKRRARCLRHLGFEHISAVDPREDRRNEIAERSQAVPYVTFDEAVAAGADFALVCVPPHLHHPYLLACVAAGLPAFCEGPLTMTLEQADQIIDAAEAAGVFIAPSCTYLHNPIHKTVKDLLDQGDLGRPLAALSHVGGHVAGWHPYEDYRGFYASKRSEGGMNFDMLPHEFHLLAYLFGDVRALSCMARRRSAEIEADPAACDVYDVLLDMEAGVSVSLHEDMFQRPCGNYRKVMCERGAIEWNWQSLRVCRCPDAQPALAPAEWRDIPLGSYDIEDMYPVEVEHALRSLDGRETYLMSPRKERRILELVLACEESSRLGRQLTW